ncbi:MAG TPA: hypothetical protein H9673_09055 [Candidatus Adamsella sp.]|nr:hypothetical protein [Candidatus Adamsella sp.]
MDETALNFLFQSWENISSFDFSKEDKKENLLSSWLLNDKYQKIKANINISKNKVKLKQILE